MGDPEPAYGLARQLERLLQARHPEKTIEVLNVAMTAIDSYVIREIARDCSGLQGDYWVVYAGNNEVVGPFGAGTVFSSQVPPLPIIRARLWLGKTRLGQLFSGWFRSSRLPHEWEGMAMFLREQVPQRDPRLRRVYGHFAANLADVLELGRSSGAKVFASTMAVNLEGCPPFSSEHSPSLQPNARTRWEQCFAIGRDAQAKGELRAALNAYNEAARLDPGFAELKFRQGCCELGLHHTGQAEADFSAARDLDTLRFRADSQINALIRKVVPAHGAVLLDAERELGDAGSSAPEADALFLDHVHLSFKGNYLLARIFAQAIERDMDQKDPSPSAGFETVEQVARRLAYTGFDRRRILQEMRLRFEQPPFSGQSDFRRRDEQLRTEIEAEKSPASELKSVYQAAIASAPRDWVLHANFARVLESENQAGAAAEQWRAVARLMPQEPDAWFHLGDLAYSAGDYDRAEKCFFETLSRKPDATEALNELGVLRLKQQRLEDAARLFRQALDLAPGFSAARVNLAAVLSGQGDTQASVLEYHRVLEMDTNNVAARINLARLLGREGRAAEALELLARAVDLKPKDAIAQFDYANALSAVGRHSEALSHYAAAASSQPSFADAHYNLGVELARAGRFEEAAAHFQEAVRLKPSSAESHFNFGVALAKLGHFQQAALEFEETLRLQPGYPGAQSFLERALTYANQEAERAGKR